MRLCGTRSYRTNCAGNSDGTFAWASGWGGEYGLAVSIGSQPVLLSMKPGTQYPSTKPLDSGPSVSNRLTLVRRVHSGMRASSRSMNRPGGPNVMAKGLFWSRMAMVSDSPQEIACLPKRMNRGPLV